VIPWDLPAGFVWSVLFCLGACVGSFLNVCVYRLPRRDDILGAWRGVIDPPSACPFCLTRIWAIDNIPIFGWLLLRGRCRACRQPISWRYPLVEFLSGVLFVGLYLVIVPVGFQAATSDSGLILPEHPLATVPRQDLVVWRLQAQYLYYLVLAELLLLASLIDLDLRIIPDAVTVPGMVIGFVGGLLGTFALVPVWTQQPALVALFWEGLTADEGPPPWWTQVTVPAWCAAQPLLHRLAVSAAGFVVGGGVIWFVRIVGQWVFRREAMGFGDVTLMAMIGSFLGWQPTLIIFFVAPMTALVLVVATLPFSRLREIPYGPFLSAGTLLVVFAWKPLYAASERFLALGPFVPVLAIVLGLALIVILWVAQGIKWCLGIPLYEPEFLGEWTAADQLAFYASQQETVAQTGWRRNPAWPGVAAGQGTQQRRVWQGR
jgi:leader peptidase (prepilin peptidase)/N-methyltransferase